MIFTLPIPSSNRVRREVSTPSRETTWHQQPTWGEMFPYYHAMVLFLDINTVIGDRSFIVVGNEDWLWWLNFTSEICGRKLIKVKDISYENDIDCEVMTRIPFYTVDKLFCNFDTYLHLDAAQIRTLIDII